MGSGSDWGMRRSGEKSSKRGYGERSPLKAESKYYITVQFLTFSCVIIQYVTGEGTELT